MKNGKPESMYTYMATNTPVYTQKHTEYISVNIQTKNKTHTEKHNIRKS